jgi:iron-sulfur cluster assembly protein
MGMDMTSDVDSSAPAMPVLTTAAQSFIRRMLRFSGKGPEAGFRLEVSPGGCSGMASRFEIEASPAPGDHVLVLCGIRLFVPAASRRLLDGVTIDFVDTRTESGLSFFDPKASCSSCASPATERSERA